MKQHIRWLGLIVLLHIAFFWTLVLSHQFSFLTNFEAANVAYSWQHFSVSSVKQGVLPLWDPYTFSGRTFVGEMQSGLFSPVKLWLYPWPLNRSGLLSPRLFHFHYVLLHLMAAVFMFLFAREIGLDEFASLIASLCFTFGGFVGAVNWPNILESAAWLPLALLFMVRAFRATRVSTTILGGCRVGLALGMAILAGSLHVPMMQSILLAMTALFLAYTGGAQEAGQDAAAAAQRRRPWRRAALILMVVFPVALWISAIQLLPSVEYSRLSLRYIGEGPPVAADHKIPYGRMSHGFAPRSLFAFFFGSLDAGAGELSTYFGMVPMLLAVAGVVTGWSLPWVRYLAGVAAVFFLYSLGNFSLLHGIVYALAPFLWMAREAGRFIYLSHFALALLAGFGIQACFGASGGLPAGTATESGARTATESGARTTLLRIERVLAGTIIALSVVFGAPALLGKPAIADLLLFSFLMMIGSYVILVVANRGGRERLAKAAIVILILSELYVFHRPVQNRALAQKSGADYFQILLDCRGLADFFLRQPGLFRVDMRTELRPNIGNLYGVETTWAFAATVLKDYERFLHTVPRANELLNVRYLVRPEPLEGRQAAYSGGRWHVYENPSYMPRAWVAHRTEHEPMEQQVLRRVADPDFDPRRLAIVNEPIPGVALPAATRSATLRAAASGEGGREAEAPPLPAAQVSFEEYSPHRLRLRVRSPAPGMLVLSEVFYPGWQASVNHTAARIYKVNGLFRGISIPAGEVAVQLHYRPRSILAGALLSVAALLAVFAVAAVCHWRRRRTAATGS